MPWTLWRYTTIELWRVVFICAAILVSVIAFAASVKPLAEGALTPIGAMRFMLLAVPPMLAYALPFAAGFGASLTYHRMAQDNETIAAHSGGVSHRALLVPAVFSGLLIAGGLVVLNESIIPRFLRSMERMVTLDVAQIMIRQIERGQAAEIGNVMIHADRIDQIPPPPDSVAHSIFLLHRVAAVQLGDNGEVVGDATVRQAWIVLAPDPARPESTVCGIQFIDGVGHIADRGLRKIDAARPRPVQIPDAFRDDPKFLTFTELRDLRDDPDRMGFIDARRLVLAERIAVRDVGVQIDRELENTGRLRLLGYGGRRYEVAAHAAKQTAQGTWLLERDESRVSVRRLEPDDAGSVRVSNDTAREAWLRIEQSEGGESVWDADESRPILRFTLQLVDVRTESAGGFPTERPQRDFVGLRLTDDPLEQYASLDSRALLGFTETMRDAGQITPGINAASTELDRLIVKLQREITSKQQERAAMAAGCLVMTLLGAIAALLHRESLPLVVYLWSFFPALAIVLLISAGQQQTHHGKSEVFGVALLWSGIAVTAGLSLVSYIKLARH